MNPSGMREALAQTSGPDIEAIAAVSKRASQVLRPGGALQRLDDLAVWLAGWQRTSTPSVDRTHVLLFAADHGVAVQDVSAYPAQITAAMKAAVQQQIATSTALASAHGATLQLIDVGVGDPTCDFTQTAALSPNRFAAAWATGVDAVASAEADLLILGELGIGNTTSAAAVAAGTLGGGGAQWCGRGTGVDDAGLARKVAAVDTGLARIGNGLEPLEVLRQLGGAELVAMAGAAVEARRQSIPLLLDGFIATAALVPLHVSHPGFLAHAIAGHCSAEPGHQKLLDALGLEPLLRLDMRLGEASGALVALPLLQSAVAAVMDVATFEEAGMG